MHGEPPPQLVRRLRQHNLAVAVAAFLAACGAVMVWAVLYVAGQWAVLSFQAATGREEQVVPAFYDLGFGLVLAVVVCAALAWRWLRPRPVVSDRPILGWHVVPELLLLPGSLLLAISDNLGAWQPVSRARVAAVWRLLCAFLEKRKWRECELPQIGLSGEELAGALLALQLAGMVDFLRGQEGPFYLLRSGVEEEVRRWIERRG